MLIAESYFNISNSHNGVVQGSNKVIKITCPVVVLTGEYDMRFRYLNAIENSIPTAKKILIPKCSHDPFIGNPKGFVSLLTNFLYDTK